MPGSHHVVNFYGFRGGNICLAAEAVDLIAVFIIKSGWVIEVGFAVFFAGEFAVSLDKSLGVKFIGVHDFDVKGVVRDGDVFVALAFFDGDVVDGGLAVGKDEAVTV